MRRCSWTLALVLTLAVAVSARLAWAADPGRICNVLAGNTSYAAVGGIASGGWVFSWGSLSTRYRVLANGDSPSNDMIV